MTNPVIWRSQSVLLTGWTEGMHDRYISDDFILVVVMTILSWAYIHVSIDCLVVFAMTTEGTIGVTNTIRPAS